ncbi:MAG: hypothetical protein KDC54_09940, partial [Lewinella sp.]|nr:hypothetical protein [Lewinella sp.]
EVMGLSQQTVIVLIDEDAPELTIPEDITIYTDDQCNYDADPEVTGQATAEDNCPSCGPAEPADPWINEIHYDNVGGDVGEFVEIAGPAGTDLNGYSVVLYTGSNGTTYNTFNLGGVLNDLGAGFGAYVITTPSNGIQNGPPDGVALIGPGGVIEFLSYEGSFTAVNGPAAGITSTDIGVSESSSTPIGESLQRTGTGVMGSDFTWVGPAPESPGSLNAGQTVEEPVTPAATVTYDDEVTPGNCPGEYIITRTWTAVDCYDNDVSDVQTITVLDNLAPVLNVPANITIYTDEECIYDASPEATGQATASDNCSDFGDLTTVYAWINEFHYDDESTDEGEFIEIAGPAGTDLSTYVLYLYNGSFSVLSVYDDMTLAGVIPDEGAGFGAIAFSYPVNGIQNGAPDGLALVKDGQVLEFLSYEGDFVAADGPAAGMMSTDIGVLEGGSDAPGMSLQRVGPGSVGSDFTWFGPFAESPGSLNISQTPMPLSGGQASPGAIVTYEDETTPGECPGEYTINRYW